MTHIRVTVRVLRLWSVERLTVLSDTLQCVYPQRMGQHIEFSVWRNTECVLLL